MFCGESSSLPLISVIMSAYNESEDWIRQSVESLINQTYANLEIIVIVDNPENVNLARLLKGYRAEDDRIVIIENKQNEGLVSSLNTALGYANGEYIARMDADDISHLDRIEKQYKFMKNHSVDLVSSRANFIVKGVVSKEEVRSDIYPDDIKKMIRYANVLVHPTWFVKKEVYITLNGYRNIPSCEDYDFVLRAVQDGYLCALMGEPLLDYRIRTTSISREKTLEQYLSMKTLRCFYRKGVSLREISVKTITQSYFDMSDFEKNLFRESLLMFWHAKNQYKQKHCLVAFYETIKALLHSRQFVRYFLDNLAIQIKMH